MNSWIASLPLLSCLLFAACSVLPEVTEKPVSIGLPQPQAGPLVTAAAATQRERRAGESSFLLIDEAGEALNWRLALIDSARSSIDIQLYLWHGGASGSLLFDRVLRAADRGVRVRILVDDFLLESDEAGIASLCRHHPNFEIRIFNPTRVRGSALGGVIEMFANFDELNRRMHNKTFTADRSMTIVGGRNIGDHYFGMADDYNFLDLDVLATGPVVEDVGDGFDEFWNSAAAYPGAMLSDKGSAEHLARGRAKIAAEVAAERDGKLRNFPAQPVKWSSRLGGLRRKMIGGRAMFLQDDPNPERDQRQLTTTLRRMTRSHAGEVQMASAYLVPSNESISKLGQAVSMGLAVKLLTSSLEASNHPVVDGHYRKTRKPMVEAGVQLFELRPDPSPEIRALADVDPVRSERVALHIKAIVGDRRRCFIGSLNLDPRALVINTESGLLIDSPVIAGRVARRLDTLMNAENSWVISRGEDGRIRWQSRGETLLKEPPAKWTRRLVSRIAGWLPIADQL